MSHNQSAHNFPKKPDSLTCRTCPLNDYLSEGAAKQPGLSCINKGILISYPCCAYLVLYYIAFSCQDLDGFVDDLRKLLSKK